MAYSKDEIEKTFNYILDKILEGKSVKSILREEKMPSSQTFWKWLKEDEEKSNQYARACEQRADMIFEELLEIVDDGTNDYTIKNLGEIEVEVFNSEHVQRSRLRFDARRWMLSKMNPKKYGDKLDLTTKDKEIQNTSIQVQIVPPNNDED